MIAFLPLYLKRLFLYTIFSLTSLLILSSCGSTKTGGASVSLSPERPSDGQSPHDAIKLKPARTNWIPGLVFLGTVSDSKILVEDILCSNLFPAIKPIEDEIALEKVNTNSDLNLNISLTPLEKLIGKEKLNIDLVKLKQEGKLSIDPGQAMYIYYARSQMWKEAQPIPVDKDCQREIDLTKENGEFENKVWIVTGATAYKDFGYTFSDAFNFESGLKADFEKLLTAAIEAKYKTNTEGGMTRITEGKLLYVRSGLPRLVSKWVKSGAVGGFEAASITTEKYQGNITEIIYE